jgi:hypothetical protein
VLRPKLNLGLKTVDPAVKIRMPFLYPCNWAPGQAEMTFNTFIFTFAKTTSKTTLRRRVRHRAKQAVQVTSVGAKSHGPQVSQLPKVMDPSDDLSEMRSLTHPTPFILLF